MAFPLMNSFMSERGGIFEGAPIQFLLMGIGCVHKLVLSFFQVFCVLN